MARGCPAVDGRVDQGRDEAEFGKYAHENAQPKPHEVAAPIMWMGLCVVLATVVVQTTRSGIDILALLVAGFILLLLERTLGDWVAESVGPRRPR